MPAKLRRGTKKDRDVAVAADGYDGVLADVAGLFEAARQTSARAVNAIMTATYWEVGRRIVEFEQEGKALARYGAAVVERLSSDLTTRFGKGFSKRNLEQMRKFYLSWPIAQTSSARFAHSDGKAPLVPDLTVNPSPTSKFTDISATTSRTSTVLALAQAFPLPWSHYVKLLSVKDEKARRFYEEEACRGGWTVRQLDRQIDTQFYERTLVSRKKSAMLAKGAARLASDEMSPDEAIKDPLVLEFLGLRDEYSESDLEEGLVRGLENFLLELGGDYAFVARQRRMRIGDQWYRIDLLFFHRRLRCLIVIDLKLGKFTHADAGQMHLYLNYTREHWTHPNENPPVGIILCTHKDAAVAHYALEGLPNKVLAAEYRTALPNEDALAEELNRTRKLIENRTTSKRRKH